MIDKLFANSIVNLFDRKEENVFMEKVKALTVGNTRYCTKEAINDFGAQRFASAQITFVKNGLIGTSYSLPLRIYSYDIYYAVSVFQVHIFTKEFCLL